MAAIYKKELRVLFQNVTGFLFMGAVLAVFGLFFFYYNISVGYPSIAVPLSNIRFFLVIMTPILCMRLLSEEKKNKTDQL
ncbi:MAG: copper ABC transporter permease, partial [Lachnospiraceae bacterium]|nr:copper ABC transporter permease [Lachnospiraceae bacterium]